jgi:beta-lactamase regulating signal transducer with metallopeptidase domain
MAADALDLLVKLNLALAGAVLLVLALRRPMRGWFGARVAYGLWWIVPAAVAAAMLPARIVEIAVTAAAPPSGAAATTGRSGPMEIPPAVSAPVDFSGLLVGVWIGGAIVALVMLALQQRAFMASLGKLTREGRVLRAEASDVGPAIIGAMLPKLILPGDFETRFSETERDLVLAHERVHLAAGDARINGLVALAQCLCWFNPLAHLGANAMRIDQELACDATVAAKHPGARRSYAEAMLKTQTAPMSLPVGCYWPAGGAHPLKLRIAMLKRDLPGEMRAAWGVVAAGLACLATGCVVWIGQPPREVVAASREISAPVSPEQANKDARLLNAVRIGGTGFAKAALESGANVNARNRDGLTPLIIAVRAEDMQLVNLLLDHGADVNLTARGEGTALVAGARRGHLRAVKALVEHGADVNVLAPGAGTPLAASVRSAQYSVVKYLVEHGADVNLPSPPQAPWDRWGVERTPLGWAVNGDHAGIERFLRSQGATM